MVGHRRSSCEEKKGASHKDDQSEYKSIQSQPDSAYDDLPSYKEAVQDDKSIPDDWVKVGYSDTGRATQRHADREQQPPCSHWSESMCRITVKSRKCCSCMDERPETNSGLYPMYVDGQGWVEKATRWQYYCPNCQGALNQVICPSKIST